MTNFEKWRDGLTVDHYVNLLLDECNCDCIICPVAKTKTNDTQCSMSDVLKFASAEVK